jgi:hypothetical protein
MESVSFVSRLKPHPLGTIDVWAYVLAAPANTERGIHQVPSGKSGDHGSTEEATSSTKTKVNNAPQGSQVCAEKTGETDRSEGNTTQTSGQGQAQACGKERAEKSAGKKAAKHARD